MPSSEQLFGAFIGLGILNILLPVLAYLLSRNSKKHIDLVGYVAITVNLIQIALLSTIMYSVLKQGPLSLWEGVIVADGFAIVPSIFVVLLSIINVVVYLKNKESEGLASVVYLSIIGLALLGSVLLSTSGSIGLFISSWLMVSVASYTAVAIEKGKLSSDASLKYALMGIVSSVFIILWIASGIYLNGDLIYSGGFPLEKSSVVIIVLFLTAGIGFKLGIFPFQWWMVDVYSMVNGRIIALITGVIKIGVILAYSRLVYYTFSLSPSIEAITLVAILSALTMTFGNIAALTSRVFPRMLAYSSIAQVGYIMVGIVGLLYGAYQHNSILVNFSSAAVAVQAISYSLAKPLAYITSGDFGPMCDVSSLKGRYKVDPIGSIALSVSLLNLLGLPPLVGFWGKVYLFQAGLTIAVWLVVIAVVNSGISSFYYGRVIADMFATKEAVSTRKFSSNEVLLAMSLLMILLGIGIIQVLFPQLYIKTF